MKIQWSHEINSNQELKERWRAAIAKSKTFSKVASFEFSRDNHRLNVLLDIIKREYREEVALDAHFRWQKRDGKWLNGLAIVFGCGLLLLQIAEVWNIRDEAFWVLFGVFIFGRFWMQHQEHVNRSHRAEASQKIAAAIFEFEEISMARLPYSDREILDDEFFPLNEDRELSFAKRRAELSVVVMEALVERIGALDQIS